MSKFLDVAAGPYAPTEVRRVLTAVCVALRDLHAQGQVHGALTSASIRFDEHGTIVLTPGRPGRSAGCAAFETYAADPAWPVGEWTDVYAVGAIGFAMMSGHAPADALTRQRDPVALFIDDEVWRTYPPSLVQAILNSLKTSPAQRTQSVTQFLEEAGWAVPDARPSTPGPVPIAVAPIVVPSPADAPLPRDVEPTPREVEPTPREVEPLPPDAEPLPREAESPSQNTKLIPVRRMVAVGLLFFIVALLWWFIRESVSTSPQGGKTPAGSTASVAPAPLAPEREAQVSTSGSETSMAASQPETQSSTTTQPPDAGVSTVPPGDLPQPGASTTSASVPPAVATEDGAQAGSQQPLPGEVTATPATPATTTPLPPATSVPVEVSIAVQPWGEVFIDGVSRGVSPPLRSVQLAPGSYRVTIRNPSGPVYSTRLTVTSGKRGRISHIFK